MEKNKIIIYQSEDGETQIDVRLENETVWLTTHQMALLFDKEESNIRREQIGELRQLVGILGRHSQPITKLSQKHRTYTIN